MCFGCCCYTCLNSIIIYFEFTDRSYVLTTKCISILIYHTHLSNVINFLIFNSGNHRFIARAEALRNSRSTNRSEAETIYAENAHEQQFAKKQTEQGDNEECGTAGCVKAASKIIERIDETVDPCENFYEFACGNFIKNTVLPDDKVTLDSFSIVRDLVDDQLKTIINEKSDPKESKPFRLAKDYNAACLNKDIIAERGIKPLADILESYGGWPVIKGDLWSDSNWNWIEVIQKFRRMGLETNIIFSFSVSTDLKNSSARVLNVSHLKLIFVMQTKTYSFLKYLD